MFDIELDDLVDMMVHPCRYCTFIEAGQCSAHKGCEQGVREFLIKEFNLKDEVCDEDEGE